MTRTVSIVPSLADIEKACADFRRVYAAIREEVARVIVGHREVVEDVLLSLFVPKGHLLLEGAPGLGKTLLVKTLARILKLRFSRIQFTPDLMPADVTGTQIVREDGAGGRRFVFEKGPIFGHLVLADEINRATPKTQSALLEAMEESKVTVAGEDHPLEEPFVVLATQNPIEMEGTYPLPEAQVDRFFFKLLLGPSSVEEMTEILRRTTGEAVAEARPIVSREEVLSMRGLVRQVPVSEACRAYASTIVRATHPPPGGEAKDARRYVRYGSSPRGAQTLILAAKVAALAAGRSHIGPEDIRAVALPALRHRVILNYEAEAEGVTPDAVVKEVLAGIPEVSPKVAAMLEASTGARSKS